MTETIDIFDSNKDQTYNKSLSAYLIFIILMMLFGSTAIYAQEVKLNQTVKKSAKSGSGIVEEWKHFSDTNIKEPSQGLSSVVVFRPLDYVQGPAVNLYIDGEYQASLLPGAYTQTSFCPGNHRFSVAYTNVLTKYKAKKRIGQKGFFSENKITYFQIDQDSKENLSIQLLSEAKALELIKKLPPRQRHTISRLNKRECPKTK